MGELKTQLQYLEWGFWGGGAVFIAIGAVTCVLISQDTPLSANNSWIPIAGMLLAGIGFIVCVGARVADGMIVKRGLQDAYAQIQKSTPGAIPNSGQLAMLAGLPESRAWQAREFLAKQK